MQLKNLTPRAAKWVEEIHAEVGVPEADRNMYVVEWLIWVVHWLVRREVKREADS